jgi:hypothetical protein
MYHQLMLIRFFGMIAYDTLTKKTKRMFFFQRVFFLYIIINEIILMPFNSIHIFNIFLVRPNLFIKLTFKVMKGHLIWVNIIFVKM